MHMNATAKWNWLFAVISVCWAIVSPLLLAAEADRRPELARRDCTETSFRLYGATDSPRFDVNRYAAEADACNRSYNSDSVRLPEVLSAMVGRGDRILGLCSVGITADSARFLVGDLLGHKTLCKLDQSWLCRLDEEPKRSRGWPSG